MSDLSATQCGCNNGNGFLDLILLLALLGGNGGCGIGGFGGFGGLGGFGGGCGEKGSCDLLFTLLLINCLCGNRC